MFVNITRSDARTPGQTKILQAVIKLLNERSLRDTTWGEIAKTAGVSEALIYQYYKDKSGLLFGVLEELLLEFKSSRMEILRGTYGALNKLRVIIWEYFKITNKNRVFSKLLIEVWSYSTFTDSKAFNIIKEFHIDLLDVVKEGVYNGEIRNDINPKYISRMILGTMEYLTRSYVLYDREFSPDDLIQDACRLIFSGITNTDYNDILD